MSVVVWSDEATSQLRALVAQGLTSRDIAKALGGITRNAVIGKMNRLGLSPVTPLPAPAKEEPLEGNQTYLMGLKNFMCRFPMGGDGPKIRFCGDPTKTGSWCPEHRKIVFYPKSGVKRNGEEIDVRTAGDGLLPDARPSGFRFGRKAE